ncbi:MAG TPA: hypothetical protein PLL49_05115 [Bacteroidales bacterium]|nr:hypothetical protein [Bacteroidales bacterium]
MRPILTIVLMIFNITVFGQSLFFNEEKMIDFRVPRSSESYESRIVRIDSQDTLVRKVNYPIKFRWNPINKNEIVGCDVWTCGKWNLITNQYDTLFSSSESFILELSANETFCFILTTTNEMERFDNYNLYKIDLKTKKIEEIKLKEHYGIINLYASNKYLAFVDYQYDEKTDNVSTQLIIYNIENEQLTIVDKAFLDQDEWLGRIDDYSVMNWENDNELYYFKQESGKSKGTILKYDVNSKTITKEFEFPYERMHSFALKEDGIIIEKDGKLLFVDKQNNEKIIYQVGYKFDFILDQFYFR